MELMGDSPCEPVLITGGAGYVGSHLVLAAREAGYPVVVLDNLSTGHRWTVPDDIPFVEGDVQDYQTVSDVIRNYYIASVIHLAASTSVPESVANPVLYYENNSNASTTLVNACIDRGVRRFVFSSSASVYGIPSVTPTPESSAASPINPYGRSKLATEWMLQDVAAARDFRFLALRYFNVAGADPDGRAGQSGQSHQHLIKLASGAAIGSREQITVFGADYGTPDGTCVRDYIHVSDLADIHVAALRSLESGNGSCSNAAFNCGYGHGFSVREVLESVRAIAPASFEIVEGQRRTGDPPILVADPTAIQAALRWTPRYDNLDFIVRTAVSWEERLASRRSPDKP